MQKPYILIRDLNYTIREIPLFNQLSLNFGSAKMGLVGRNGVGKSTLMKLILGELKATSGKIEIQGKIVYCPQQFDKETCQTLADLLNLTEKFLALKQIEQGSTETKYYELLQSDWNFAEEARQTLQAFDLAHLSWERQLPSLSGGEKMRFMLAKTFMQAADFIFLDEPTNNLDEHSRNLLYRAIENSKKGMLIISHDRQLLNLMEEIYESSSLGIKVYGGNYQDYLEQKQIEQAANLQALADAKKFLQKTQQSIQSSREKHEQRQAKGKKERKAGKIDKISANSARGRSERTQGRLAKLNDALIERADEKLKLAKEKIETETFISVAMPNTYVPRSKLILEITDLSFYHTASQPLIEDFNLSIYGPERIAIHGKNGSGKTTLLKLIQGKFIASSGVIKRGTERVSYLDQEVTLLDPEKTILDNFLAHNPDSTLENAYFCCADFLFRNQDALKIVKNLSGGEKLRAALACILLSKQAPQLLILDEPTNNLDLSSIESLESALQNYQGALLVVSHDVVFLQNIHIMRNVEL